MNMQEKNDLSPKIRQVIQDLQSETDPWVDLARIGAPLDKAGVQYKQYGFLKLRHFLDQFGDMLAFRDERPGEEKPPVYYVRLKTDGAQEAAAAEEKEGAEEKSGGRATSNSEKPPYQNGKSVLMAFGFVNEQQGVLEKFFEATNVRLTQRELESKIKESYDEGDILYYEYDENGDPVKRDTFSSETASFAINTGVRDGNQNYVFAQYSKGSRGWVGVNFYTEDRIFNQMNAYKIGKLTFKDYSSANDFIKSLHKELLPGETWKYGASSHKVIRKKTEYEILESYLRTVFEVLLQEYDDKDSLNYEKIKFSKDNNYALFNTGLLSKYATDIILIGEVYPKNRAENSPFTLSNPTILLHGKTELVGKGFGISDDEVDMVSFFDKVSQIVYDAKVKVDTGDMEKLRHCIDEGIKRNRFPQKCKEQYENGELEDLTNRFKSAIKRAEIIARRNYKYVVPQCRITKKGKEIQFLMPIYMSSKYEEAPDFALVLSESAIGDQKFYKPETVLELAWAYNNARVICKPDNTWLNPARIEDVEDPEMDE